MKYAFIKRYRSQFAIIRMCEALGVSESGYYAWRERPPSRRDQEDAGLLEKIREIHQRYRQACGSDKTWRLLKADGVACGRHRVARLRRSYGIEAIRMKRFRGSYAARNSEPAACYPCVHDIPRRNNTQLLHILIAVDHINFRHRIKVTVTLL